MHESTPRRRGGDGGEDFLARLEKAPWTVSWFSAMRWLQARNVDRPRFGRAARPGDEVVRVRQMPSLEFASSELKGAALERGRLVLHQAGFGLFGPNGPLPLHLTEYARSLSTQDKDEGFVAFADIFHHRLALLFFRAWAATQPCVSLDRADSDDFGRYVSSLSGYGEASLRGRDAVPDAAKRFMSGHLVRSSRNGEGLASILGWFFGCEVSVEEWVPSWMELAEDDQTVLGREEARSALGQGAICGCKVPDRAHRFRLHVGPLAIADYESLLPGGGRHEQMRDWVRNYVGFELLWDARLILRADDVPATRLSHSGRLGWTSWLAGNPDGRDRADLKLNFERCTTAAACA